MELFDVYDVIAAMDGLNSYARRRKDDEYHDLADLWAVVLQEVPKGFALGYIQKASREGRKVREVSDIAGAWRRHTAEARERSPEALIPPDALAEDVDAWLEWARTARAVFASTGSVQTARTEANRAVGHHPELEPNEVPVPEIESSTRLREVLRHRRIERVRGGDPE